MDKRIFVYVKENAVKSYKGDLVTLVFLAGCKKNEAPMMSCDE